MNEAEVPGTRAAWGDAFQSRQCLVNLLNGVFQ